MNALRKITSAVMAIVVSITSLGFVSLASVYGAADSLETLYGGGGAGSESNPYVIADESDFICLSQARYAGAYFIQTADFDVYLDQGAALIDEFKGVYDGDGYEISAITSGYGFTLDQPVAMQSLFGRVYSGSSIKTEIKNLRVDVNIQSAPMAGSSQNSSLYMGALAAVLENASVTDCAITGAMSADIPQRTGSQGFTIAAGGIAGMLYGRSDIVRCATNIQVDISGDLLNGDALNAGGLVGRIMPISDSGEDGSIIENCLVDADMNISAVNTNAISAVGGLFGEAENGAVRRIYGNIIGNLQGLDNSSAANNGMIGGILHMDERYTEMSIYNNHTDVTDENREYPAFYLDSNGSFVPRDWTGHLGESISKAVENQKSGEQVFVSNTVDDDFSFDNDGNLIGETGAALAWNTVAAPLFNSAKSFTDNSGNGDSLNQISLYSQAKGDNDETARDIKYRITYTRQGKHGISSASLGMSVFEGYDSYTLVLSPTDELGSGALWYTLTPEQDSGWTEYRSGISVSLGASGGGLASAEIGVQVRERFDGRTASEASDTSTIKISEDWSGDVSARLLNESESVTAETVMLVDSDKSTHSVDYDGGYLTINIPDEISPYNVVKIETFRKNDGKTKSLYNRYLMNTATATAPTILTSPADVKVNTVLIGTADPAADEQCRFFYTVGANGGAPEITYIDGLVDENTDNLREYTGAIRLSDLASELGSSTVEIRAVAQRSLSTPDGKAMVLPAGDEVVYTYDVSNISVDDLQPVSSGSLASGTRSLSNIMARSPVTPYGPGALELIKFRTNNVNFDESDPTNTASKMIAAGDTIFLESIDGNPPPGSEIYYGFDVGSTPLAFPYLYDPAEGIKISGEDLIAFGSSFNICASYIQSDGTQVGLESVLDFYHEMSFGYLSIDFTEIGTPFSDSYRPVSGKTPISFNYPRLHNIDLFVTRGGLDDPEVSYNYILRKYEPVSGTDTMLYGSDDYEPIILRGLTGETRTVKYIAAPKYTYIVDSSMGLPDGPETHSIPITLNAEKIQSVEPSPYPGFHPEGTQITLSTPTETDDNHVKIVYETVDYGDPAPTLTESSPEYDSSTVITLDRDMELYVKAFSNNDPADMDPTDQESHIYFIDVPNPYTYQVEATPLSGEVEAGTAVALATDDPMAKIYYEVAYDGAEPNALNYDTSTKYSTPIVISKHTKITAAVDNDGEFRESKTFEYTVAQSSSSSSSSNSDSDVTIGDVVFSEDDGELPKGTRVYLSTDTKNAKIYYTIAYDNKKPDDPVLGKRQTYNSRGIEITRKTTINAVAMVGEEYGDVTTAEYKLAKAVGDPKPSVKSESIVPNGTRIAIKSTDNADIYYTLDGSDPTSETNSSAMFGSPITIDGKNGDVVEVNVYATKEGFSDSNVVTLMYIIGPTGNLVKVSPAAGETVMPGDSISMSTAATDAVILYTTDGSEPHSASPSGKKVTVEGEAGDTFVLKAAVMFGDIISDTYTFEYKIGGEEEQQQEIVEEGKVPEAPVASIPSGAVVVKNAPVELSAPAGKIFYTLDGSDPDKNSTPYTEPIIITAPTVLKAIALLDDKVSEIAEFSYTLTEQVGAPVAIPASGDIKIGDKVTMKSPTTGALIYYSTDGSDPTIENIRTLTPYDGPITVTRPITLKMIAVMNGMTASPVTAEQYTVSREIEDEENEEEESEAKTDSDKMKFFDEYMGTSGNKYSGVVLRDMQSLAVISSEKGVIPEDSRLVIVREDNPQERDRESVRNALNLDIKTLYDVSLIHNGVPIQPEKGEVIEFGLPIPAGYEDAMLILCRINENGTVSSFPTRRSDGYAYAEVDNINKFAIAIATDVDRTPYSTAMKAGIFTACFAGVAIIGYAGYSVLGNRKKLKER